ncbi:MAG TPA: hypothetical protein VFL31_01840 [Nitrospiraceae bacterium]|nr:hypothetical protein [Nitrospiraceae bacterium]
MLTPSSQAERAEGTEAVAFQDYDLTAKVRMLVKQRDLSETEAVDVSKLRPGLKPAGFWQSELVVKVLRHVDEHKLTEGEATELLRAESGDVRYYLTNAREIGRRKAKSYQGPKGLHPKSAR